MIRYKGSKEREVIIMEEFLREIMESDIKSRGLWDDFVNFSNCIDMAKEKFGMSENDAIAFVSSIWECPEI